MAAAGDAWIASARRDSSPAEAILAAGGHSSPGFGAIWDTAVSAPVASNATRPTRSIAGSWGGDQTPDNAMTRVPRSRAPHGRLHGPAEVGGRARPRFDRTAHASATSPSSRPPSTRRRSRSAPRLWSWSASAAACSARPRGPRRPSRSGVPASTAARGGLERGQGRRIVVHRLREVAHLRGEVLQLRRHAGEPLHERLVARVEAREGCCLRSGERRQLARARGRLRPGLVAGQQPAQRRGPTRDRLGMRDASRRARIAAASPGTRRTAAISSASCSSSAIRRAAPRVRSRSPPGSPRSHARPPRPPRPPRAPRRGRHSRSRSSRCQRSSSSRP